ncbi:MAG: hypothetical protein ACLQU3_10830 [Limisphaerales bacterium]|jgi:hypothetical protein
MNANLLRNALYACGLAAAGLSAFAGPFQRGDVAAEPAWVVHVDCDSLRPTAIGQYLLAEMEKPEAKAKLVEVQNVFGFDPRKQLHGLTLYSTGKVPQEGVLMVYGDFDADRLITMVSGAQDYQTTPYKKHVIHNWIDEKRKAVNGVQPRVYAAIQGAHIIVLAQQEARVAQALDVLDRAAPSLAASGVFPQMGASGSTSIIQAAARKLDLPDSTPNAAILRLAKGARLQADVGQGQLRATLKLETSDPDVAQQITIVGHGLVALMKLQKDNPGSLKLAEALSLKQDGAGVVATLSIPTSEVIELIKADMARKAQQKAEKE